MDSVDSKTALSLVSKLREQKIGKGFEIIKKGQYNSNIYVYLKQVYQLMEPQCLIDYIKIMRDNTENDLKQLIGPEGVDNDCINCYNFTIYSKGKKPKIKIGDKDANLINLVLSIDLANKIAHKVMDINQTIIKNYFKDKNIEKEKIRLFCRNICDYVKAKNKEDNESLNDTIDKIKSNYNINETELKDFFDENGENVQYLLDIVENAFYIKTSILTRVTSIPEGCEHCMLEECGWSYGVLPPEEIVETDIGRSIFVEIPQDISDKKSVVKKALQTDIREMIHIGNIYEIMLPTDEESKEELITVLKNKNNDKTRTEWGVKKLEKDGKYCVHVTVPIAEKSKFEEEIKKFAHEMLYMEQVASTYEIVLEKGMTQEKFQELTLTLREYNLTVGNFLKDGTEKREHLFRFVCDIPFFGQMYTCTKPNKYG